MSQFFADLGTEARGQVSGDLFDISSAYNYGGKQQGAGNTGYDLNAALGAFSNLEEDDNEKEDDQLDDWFAAF